MKKIDKGLLLTLFGGYTIKAAVLGASPSDAAVILVLAAAHFLYNLQIENKEITQLKQELSKFKELQDLHTKEILDLKTMGASLKLAGGMRQTR
jgi:hypothetical protein